MVRGKAPDKENSLVKGQTPVIESEGNLACNRVQATIICKISKYENVKSHSKTVTTIPDSGADKTICPKSISDELGLEIDPSIVGTIRLTNASGDIMEVYGESYIYFTPTHGSHNNITRKVKVLVAESDKKDILLGVHKLTKWGLLDQNFWNACNRTEVELSKLDKLKLPFKNIKDEDIQEEHFMLLRNMFFTTFSNVF